MVGDLVYIADGSDGLEIIRFRKEAIGMSKQSPRHFLYRLHLRVSPSCGFLRDDVRLDAADLEAYNLLGDHLQRSGV